MNKELCPRCHHPLEDHNDAGTIGKLDRGMCCYYNDSREREGRYVQFLPGGQPYVCGCWYDGPGTEKFQ